MKTRLLACSVVLAACTHEVVVVEESMIRILPPAPSAEAGGGFAIVAQRVGPPVGSISIDYATADATATAGIDYTASTGTLRWSDGDAADKMIPVAVLDDLAIEGEEAFSIALAGQTAVPLVIADDDRVGDAYALTSSGRLVTFDRATPSAIRHAVMPTGLAPGESILGIDVRPRDGKLYALSDGARIYTLDPTTGAAALAATLAADPADATQPYSGLAGTAFGIDFNPVPDRLRVVSDIGQNLRIDVATGNTTTDAPVRGAASGLVAAGYTNNFADACRTRLYAIDPRTDVLLLQDPPNDGVTTAVGSGLGVDATTAVLDLVTDASGATSAFAILATAGTSGVYSIDLTTGRASLAGMLGLPFGEKVRGLAFALWAAGPIAQPPGELVAATAANRLLSINRGAPAKPCTNVPITGLTPGDEIVGIDVRPSTNVLYALANRGGQGTLYVLDPATGAASSPVSLTQPLVGAAFGVDFNPTGLVALRIVSDTGQSLRVTDVATGATTMDGAINGPSTGLGGAAYTNSVAGAGTTTLYTIDPAVDRLRIQTPPNAGTQVDVGALGVDATAVAGFELDGRDNTAFAALDLAGGTATTLHTIDLATGAVSPSLGAIGGGARLRGLARPAPATSVLALLEPNQLVSISLANPSAPVLIGTVSGLVAGEVLLGIDVRPSTGILYGLGSLGRVYAIDPATAAATLASTLAADPTDATNPFAGLRGVDFGVDFNPTGPVALRVISDAEQNLRIPNVLTGAAITDLDLAATGLAVDAAAAAYSNSFAGSLATTLYVIDVTAGQLLIQSPPNDGTLTPVGALGLTLGGRATFDIAGGANGIALAALQRTGESFSRLYRVDLTTGAATELGAGIGSGPPVRGLAIRIR